MSEWINGNSANSHSQRQSAILDAKVIEAATLGRLVLLHQLARRVSGACGNLVANRAGSMPVYLQRA
jgi:hypothetical protein